jgi:hypothetical protein
MLLSNLYFLADCVEREMLNQFIKSVKQMLSIVLLVKSGRQIFLNYKIAQLNILIYRPIIDTLIEILKYK